MTLRELLDQKVKADLQEGLYNEIGQLFQKADVDELCQGVTIYIFSNDSTEILYNIGFDDTQPLVGKKFKRKYPVAIFADMVKPLIDEGLVVEGFDIKDNGTVEAKLTYIYTP